MKQQNEEYPGWFVWMYDKGPILFFVGIFILLIVVVGLAWFVDSRVNEIEERLNYVPPSSYKAPDLTDYDAGEVAFAQLPLKKMVYVPVYSHVYFQGGSPYSLETTLSVRNTDPDQPVYLDSIKYFDTSGKLSKTFVDTIIKLEPLQTIEFLIERADSTGGSGANFLVEWAGEDSVSSPLIEAVMVGNSGTQAISFGRSGIVVSD